jgi:hypothetical protein
VPVDSPARVNILDIRLDKNREAVDGYFLLSIRAPLSNRTGADEVARQFPTGGGRKAAAGINELPAGQLEKFMGVMAEFWR